MPVRPTLLHRMALVSCLLFRKNLGKLREFFGQMVYRPPWQKIARTPMDTRTSEKPLGLMRKSITARALHRTIDFCHAAAILSQEIKKALYLHGHLVLTARLTVQKQSFFNLLGQNGPRDKGLFTFYGGRVNGPPESFLFLNLNVF